MIAFAVVLGLAAAVGWIAARAAAPLSRIYLRFACVLYAALAAGVAMNIAPEAAARIVMPLATAALALAAYGAFRAAPKPVLAALVLSGACLAGLWSAASGHNAVSDLAQGLCLITLLTLARQGFLAWRAPKLYLALGALAFLAALAAAQSDDKTSFTALLLFSAAGLLGTALALARASEFFVQQRRKPDGGSAIRRMR